MKLEFNIVDFTNVMDAIKVHHEIFPNEDGTLNLLGSLDRELFMKVSGLFYVNDKIKYYLAYLGNEIIGITGLYSYVDKWPNDAWIGWYGVKKEYRNKGFGSQILEWTINKAKEEEYETIRLYTDMNENKKAIELYKKNGFIEEKYSAEELKYDCYIYSKNLTNKPLILWNNKKLGLSYQSELDQLDKSKVNELLKKFENYIKSS